MIRQHKYDNEAGEKLEKKTNAAGWTDYKMAESN